MLTALNDTGKAKKTIPITRKMTSVALLIQYLMRSGWPPIRRVFNKVT